MPSRTEVITPALLRDWPLPAGATSKYGRGQVVVIGGARSTPGAALLAGVAALRVGAGRLTMAVARSVSIPLAIELPEAGVVGLPETENGSPDGSGIELLAGDLQTADALLVGPGLDDPERTTDLLGSLGAMVPHKIPVLLDAFALGVLPQIPTVAEQLAGRLVLTPNPEEASRLLGVDEIDEHTCARIAKKYDAVVTCQGRIAAADGSQWEVSTGLPGLATSGSGDVLAGALIGILARGADPAQAACWATHLHAAAGDRLATRIGTLGYLARELPNELPTLLDELAP
ncbi:NAD(P)H-hydrate dehydratase [Cellulomonas sp. P5_E12]